LNSKMSELLMVKEGQMLFGQIMGPIAEAAKQSAGEGGFEMNEGMMQMMGGFTVLRLIGMLGMTGLKMNKEELLELNAKLNQIKKA
ncbi:MAG: glycoside hydrolase family 2 protein, partial [Clostridia bacterium]|nr:glycoside hydrolase family 2 protein [Clostridia bacterium]